MAHLLRMGRTRDPELSDVILAAISGALDNVYTAVPGIAQSYDAASQTADVQPAVKRSYVDEKGDRQPERMPLIPRVPVAFQGGGGMRTTYPVKPGDTGLLVFCSASIDTWASVGGEVDPGDDRRHHPADAIFIPGLRSPASPLGGASSSFMSVGSDATNNAVEIDDGAGEVRIGKGASHKTVYGDVLHSTLTTLNTAITTAFAAINTYAVAIQATADPSHAVTPALTTAMTTTLSTAITAFETAWAGILTSIAKVK